MSIFSTFRHPFYARIHACCVHARTHAHHFPLDLSRGGAASRFTVDSPRVVSCAYRDACVPRMPPSLSSPPLLPRSAIFFSSSSLSAALLQRTLSMCEENDLGPTRLLAEPRGSLDRRLDDCQFFVPSRAEPGRARPSRADTADTHASPARSPGTLCIVDLDGALTAVPFPWPSSTVLELCLCSNQIGGSYLFGRSRHRSGRSAPISHSLGSGSRSPWISPWIFPLFSFPRSDARSEAGSFIRGSRIKKVSHGRFRSARRCPVRSPDWMLLILSEIKFHLRDGAFDHYVRLHPRLRISLSLFRYDRKVLYA